MQRPLPRRLIRKTDSFVIEAARAPDGRDVTLVRGGPALSPAEAIQGLSTLRTAHGGLSHRALPLPVAANLSGDGPWVAFDFPAICDASDLIVRLAERTAPIPYAGADAFIATLREALQHAHAATPPRFIGRLSAHNILFSEDGRWALLGLERNVPLEVKGAVYDSSVATFQAPEMIAGAPPTPITDFVALIFLMRSVLPYAALPERLSRLMRGDFRPEDEALAGHLMNFEMNVVSALPGTRLSIEEAVSISNQVREELGVALDPEAFRRHAERLLAGIARPPVSALAPDASFVETPEGRVSLGRSQRRLMLALFEAGHCGLKVEECAAAGWPGQRLVGDSGRTRVYTLVRQLRRLGVQIDRFDGGYRLAPTPAVR